MLPLLLLAVLGALTCTFLRSDGWRIAWLRALTAFAAILVLLTETASLFGAITRPVLASCWAVILVALLIKARPRLTLSARPTLLEAAGIAGIAAILLGVGYTALVNPPNSVDALSYHLPRVLYWIQNRSVAFFPTSYLNLIMMQPVTEYVFLHLYLLAGGDSLINLVQFTAFAGCIVAVSSIAGELGLSRRAQIVAAIFCATLPNGVLQASGAKNDCVLALWLACSVLFFIRYHQTKSLIDLTSLALAAGLAFGTKGTAYLFLPAFLCGARFSVRRASARPIIAAVAAGILLINAPQYVRNIDLSGSPLGFDSAHGDGAFRWRNDHLGWRATVSNALRNLSEQLGSRSDKWNQSVYQTVLSIHEKLGLDPQDPATTWRWSEYEPPRNANHEANANNRWHLLIIAIASVVALFDRRWRPCVIAPAGGFLAFCFYLKWQPYFSRLELPLFVISAPLAAMALVRVRSALLHIAVCAALLSNTRLAVTQNWTRPLNGGATYFTDMVQWNNRASYVAAVDRVAATSCRLVGVDNLINHIEYPFQALLLQRHPETRFVHTAVTNPSAKYANPSDAPCAVLCIDCADNPDRLAHYTAYPRSEIINRFVLFFR